MFRKMRRGEKATDITRAEELLKSQDYGILSVNGDDGYPYGVPLNYVYHNGKIYLHGTSGESHKTDAINRNEKVSFTIITEHALIPEKLDTMYTSVIAFGRARVLTNDEEKVQALRCLLIGLSPELAGETEKIFTAQNEGFIMIEIDVEHITGKIGR